MEEISQKFGSTKIFVSNKTIDNFFIKKTQSYAILTAEEEQKLIKRIRNGDEEARLLFFNSNLRLIPWVLKRRLPWVFNNNNDIDPMDLIQEGLFGLENALEKFDSNIGKFSTYAVWWIFSSMQRFLENSQRTIRFPVHVYDNLNKYLKVRNKHCLLSDEMDISEISKEADITTEKALDIEELLKQKTVSLDKRISNDEEKSYLYEMIKDPFGDKQEDYVDQSILQKELIGQLKENLSPKQIEILELRFGLNGEGPYTLEEVGQKFNVTRERVRQIQEKAFSVLRSLECTKKLFSEHFGYEVNQLQTEIKFDLNIQRVQRVRQNDFNGKSSFVDNATKVQYSKVFEPYKYQNECLQSLTETREQGENKALILKASGLGKTVTSAFDVAIFLDSYSQESRVLYLCHRDHILKQAHETFLSVLGGDPENFGFFVGSERKSDAQFLFATFQSITNCLNQFKPDEFDYIIIDEAHHGYADTYKRVVDFFNPVFLLGITATPERMDKKSIEEIFNNNVVFDLRIEQALARGLLTDVRYRIMSDEIIESNFAEFGKNITLKELNKSLFFPKRDQEIVEIVGRKVLEESVTNPKIMFFCSSIKHAENLGHEFPDIIPIHSQISPSERFKRESDFRSGVISKVAVVDQFNEGFDIPETNVLVFLRSTTSSRIFYQQLGRGLRPHSSKKFVLVLDFVANCERVVMVHELYEKVKRAHLDGNTNITRVNKTQVVKSEDVIDIGNFKFTETAKNIFDIIRTIRDGRSKEQLINDYLILFEKLKRTPLKKDLDEASKRGETASSYIYINTFGTLTKLQEITGVKVLRYIKLSKNEILEQYKKLAKELERKPNSDDIKKASRDGKIVSTATIKSKFGSFLKLQEEAGFNVSRYMEMDKDILLEQYKKLHEKLGKIPGSVDIENASKRGETASYPVFKAVWGSLEEIRRTMGLKADIFKKFDKEILLKQYLYLEEKLGKEPSMRTINQASKNGEIASYSTFKSVFGSREELSKLVEENKRLKVPG